MASNGSSPNRDNKELTRRIFEALNDRDVATITDLVHEDLVHHALGTDNTTTGRDEWIERIAEFGVAFPDSQLSLEEVVGEGDRVMCRVTMSGTFTDTFDGQAPSGRSAAVAGFHELRFEDGQIVEWWRLNNVFGWGKQLDALPLGPRSLARIALRQLRWKLAGNCPASQPRGRSRRSRRSRPRQSSSSCVSPGRPR